MSERNLLRTHDALEWMEVATEAAVLGFESAAVMGLRLAGAVKGGPKAEREAWRMYSEKVVALAELQPLFMTGALGAPPSRHARGALRHYRRKVAANRRRLSRR